MKIDIGSFIRTVLLFVALVNQMLSMNGMSPIPVSDEELEQLISGGFLVATSLLAWWKNNFISKKGLKQKEALKRVGL